MTKILIDGGAAINIMPYALYQKLGKGDQDLTKTDMMLKILKGTCLRLREPSVSS